MRFEIDNKSHDHIELGCSQDCLVIICLKWREGLGWDTSSRINCERCFIREQDWARVLQLILIYTRAWVMQRRKKETVEHVWRSQMLFIAGITSQLCCRFILPAVIPVYLWNEIRTINISAVFLRYMWLYFPSIVSFTYREIDRTKDT